MSETRTPITDDDEAIEELTTRAIAQIYPSPEDLAVELRSGRILTAYIGIDPTAPDLHVGHESQLLKLRRLQKLGHNIIMLIGDFTGMIGDPSDKSAARVKLTRDEVLHNSEGYKKQAGGIIDFDDPVNPAQIKYNSEWLGKMTFEEVVELASEFSVQQMIERDMFKRRINEKTPVWLHEFLYPLMQGWDSVAMGVDIEVGGSDQIFNMLVGTTLVKRFLDKQKFVIAGQLLVDPGGKKIGKTEGNMITLTDTPTDMYHKIMLWGDQVTPHALELCTEVPMSQVREIENQLSAGVLSGIEGKRFLARTIISDLYGEEEVTSAEATYDALTSNDPASIEGSEEITPSYVQAGQSLIDILHNSGLATSRSAARRLIEGGAVRINGQKIEDSDWTIGNTKESLMLQVGKKKRENFRRLVIDEPHETS